MIIQKLLLLNVYLVLTACSSMQVVNDFDPGYEFTTLKSFNWSPDSDIGQQSREMELYFKNTMEQQLVAKGLSRDENNPDFLIAYELSVQPRMETGDINNRLPAWQNTGEIYHYDEGTMVVDFIDASSKQLIYRSSLQAEVNRIKDNEKRRKRINEAVDKILQQFPPDNK